MPKTNLTSTPHITVTGKDLSLTRSGHPVFSRLSFDVKSGDCLQLQGENGSGKTSLLRVIAGFLSPNTGTLTATFNEPDINMQEQLHYIGHQSGLKPGLTVKENLETITTWLGGDVQKIQEALTYFDMSQSLHQPVGSLSAGQRRKVSFCRLLTTARAIWLLDEPQTALDTKGIESLTRLIVRHLSEGGLCIAAVHSPLSLPHSTLSLTRPSNKADS